jgi:hypothetical protein
MRVALLGLVVVGLTACGPQMTGTDAGVGCRDTTKSPANLLENPGFECGEATGNADWSAVFGTLELAAGGRTGRAAKLTVNAAGGRFAYAKTFAESPANKTYCFSAWLSGTAPFMRMRVLRDFGGSVQEVSFSDQIFPDFRKIPTLKVTGDMAPKIQLVFEVQTNRPDGQNAMAGQTMLIDDVDVWESTSNCSEPR